MCSRRPRSQHELNKAACSWQDVSYIWTPGHAGSSSCDFTKPTVVLSGEMVAATPLKATSCSSGQDRHVGSAQFGWTTAAIKAAGRPAAASTAGGPWLKCNRGQNQVLGLELLT